ncbi:MAG: hypothetical protein H6671_12515 [Anaerolineaceae bacterium]|nr:hypothetical protein [Anaerolineaceae bacterium]
MLSATPQSTSRILWPLKVIWRLVTLILRASGRLFAIILGLMLVLVGGLLASTGLLAVCGLPLVIFGFLLLVRGLF